MAVIGRMEVRASITFSLSCLFIRIRPFPGRKYSPIIDIYTYILSYQREAMQRRILRQLC